MISNVLAERYASSEMKAIWSGEGRVLLERELWIAVMKAQRDLGLPIPEDAIRAYEDAKENVDLASIQRRERVTLHDVKARIEEFCELAGAEHIHKGLTSRDLTENVEQLQVRRSLEVIALKTASALGRLSEQAKRYRNLVLTARTHNVPAQATTFGKRLAMFGQEILEGFRGLEGLLENYPVRGIKGAVGTQLDLATLFEADEEKVELFEEKIIGYLGFSRVLSSVGQVYPRSLDFQVLSCLYQVSAGASSFAKTLRLMAGHELAGEGFQKGQVGSSAMPHKMNSRSCERINGFHVLLHGYLDMTASLAGDQWNEGDVSCSVVRRIALPDAFFAMDGLLETFLTVLGQMEAFASVVEQENQKYLPFLSTTTILMESVKAGAGREESHEAIKEHALAAVRDLRSGVIMENDLLARLARDERIPLSQDKLHSLIANTDAFIGSAARQVDAFVATVEKILKNHPEAAAYEPGRIL